MLPSKDFKTFRALRRGEFFVAGVDPSHGGGDNTAGQFISQKWLDVPMVYHSPMTITHATPMLDKAMNYISTETGVTPVISYETNNGGDFELERLGRLNRYGMYRIATEKRIDPTGRLVDTGKIGWNTNTGTRPKMLRELKEAVEGELIHIYHRQTIDEMFSFIINQATGKPEAETNAHDDLVMSLAIAWQMQQTETPMIEQGGGVVETDEGQQFYKDPGVVVVG